MAELQDLAKRRANARHEVNLELDYMSPLLQLSPEEAINLALRFSYYIKRMDAIVKPIKIMWNTSKRTLSGVRRRWM